MCIPKSHKIKLLVTKCLTWDIAFHIEHHFHEKKRMLFGNDGCSYCHGISDSLDH